MNGLVDLLGKLLLVFPAGPPLRLRSERPLDEVVLAEGYALANWRIDTDRDRRVLFLKLAGSSPLVQQGDAESSLHRFGCSECTFEEHSALGLTAAWADSELAISLDSHERWRRPILRVMVETLDEDAVAQRSDADVRHVALLDHIDHHREWLSERARRSVADARDLWARRSDLLPYLVFCREVEKQLAEFDAGSPHFRNIVNRMFELNAVFQVWSELVERPPLHPEFVPSKCSPETPQTLAEEAADHTSTLPGGATRVFSWHVRFTPGAGRIFFDCDSEAGRGIVGIIAMKKGGRLT